MHDVHTVGELLHDLGLQERLQRQVELQLREAAKPLLIRLWTLPLKRSKAVTRLGSYHFLGVFPQSIRLQFSQEPELLEQTFLHEIAHFLDHQTQPNPRIYRRPHGVRFQFWYGLIGGLEQESGSPAMAALYQQKLKVVARCQRCGTLVQRLRSLPRKKNYLHRQCGGKLQPLD